jgi:microcystin-dependent protein
MSLETATYIGDLVATNPPPSDPIAQAANHLCLIKAVLQNTFPKVDSAMTATVENLNNGTPVGLIAMWSGTSLPAGWTLCNGVAVARMDGTGNITPPDLRDRFIVGSGLSYTIGNTGGVATQTAVAAHTHGVTDNGHAHGVEDNGHAHGVVDNGHNHSVSYNGGTGPINGFGGPISPGPLTNTTTAKTGISIAASGTGIGIAASGTGIAIQSAGTAGGVENRPPYYALAFIMKI